MMGFADCAYRINVLLEDELTLGATYGTINERQIEQPSTVA